MWSLVVSVLGAVASVLGNLFGTPSAVERVLDRVSNGIDTFIKYKAGNEDAEQEARLEGLRTYNRWLESTSGSRLARRILAFVFTIPWALETMIATFMRAAVPFVDDEARRTALTVSASALWKAAMDNNVLVGAVVAFYFGGPVAMDAISGSLGRWTEKKQNRGDRQ